MVGGLLWFLWCVLNAAGFRVFVFRVSFERTTAYCAYQAALPHLRLYVVVCHRNSDAVCNDAA